MTKTKIKTSKLALSVETVRALEHDRLSRVVGGNVVGGNVPSLRCSYYCTMMCSEGCY